MTTRTGNKIITFHRPFHLKDVDRMLPPGDYRVVTDEEVIEGISFTAYHRISTVIFVPAEAGCAVEMMTIDPMDLQAVHEQDVAMLAVHSVVGRIVGHHNLVGAGIGTVHAAYSNYGRQAAQAPE